MKNIRLFFLLIIMGCFFSCNSQQENQSSIQDSILKKIANDELYIAWSNLLTEHRTNIAMNVYDLEGIVKMLEEKNADISITQVPKETLAVFKGGLEYYRLSSEIEDLSRQVTQKYPMMRDFTTEDFSTLKKYCTKCDVVDTRKLLNNLHKN